MSLPEKEHIKNDLKRRILKLDLQPGERLDETSLSNQYGISRTPLRDIFRSLAGDGFIELKENRGAIVTPMNHMVIHTFFLTAPMIYRAVSKLSARNRGSRFLDELKTSQRAFENAIKNYELENIVLLNDHFHCIMGEMTENPYIMAAQKRLLIDHARIGHTFWQPKDPEIYSRHEEAIGHHEELIIATENGDEKRSVELSDLHWELTRDYLEDYMRPTPLDLEID